MKKLRLRMRACGFVESESVAWRLKQAIPFWRDVLLAPPSVLRVLEEGYKLPFITPPSPFHKRNSPSSLQYQDFVSAEVKRLVEAGVVLPVADRPSGVCSLGVDDSREKLRLIANEIPLNVFLSAAKFRYESVNTARDSLFPNDSLVQFDFRAAYHHIRMWLGHVGWLGFWWQGSYYVFLALPFGLCSAPYAFTKVARVLVRFFRSKGVRLTLMLDDGLIALAPGQGALVPWVRQVIFDSGFFLVAEDKSCWVPSLRSEGFLGYTIDVSGGVLGITEKRRAKVKVALSSIDLHQPVLRRVLASLVGRITSMSLVLGSIVRMMTRACYKLTGGDGRYRWDECVEWSAEAQEEVVFWRGFEASGRFASLVPLWAEYKVADLIVSSDASDTGVGAVCGHEHLALPLPLVARGTSSSCRELHAVLLALQVFGERFLRGKRVEWRMDSQAAASILISGSRVQECHEVARAVCELVVAFNVVLVPVWVPREDNTVADELSNFTDWGDYILSDATFERVCVALSLSPDVDLFAALDNWKCDVYFTRFASPGSAGANAFLFAWERFACVYAFPPIPLLSLLLRRLLESRTRAVVVLPVWPSQPWWPLLCPDGVHARPAVRSWFRLRRSDFGAGPSGPPAFLRRSSWRFAAVAIVWDSVSALDPAAPIFCSHRFLGRGCASCG